MDGSSFVNGAQIQAGGANVATTFVSATELEATVTIPSGTSALSINVTNPNPGAAASNSMNAAIYVTTVATAARLLDQATFGPSLATIRQVQSTGVDAWITQQFNTPDTPLANIPTPLPAVCLAANTPTNCEESEWWQTVLTGPDQLRQRVAFALSEIFVISSDTDNATTITYYHNTLAQDAFTNFYTIMHDVSVSPGMGAYLNMLNSAKAPAGEIPNENYPRELMQLFTIGLDLLNDDGTLQLDGSGNPIPTYTQAQVQEFAAAYTGWTYATASGGVPTKFPNNTANYLAPMVAVESEHDTTAKTLLNGTVLPGWPDRRGGPAGRADQHLRPSQCRAVRMQATHSASGHQHAESRIRGANFRGICQQRQWRSRRHAGRDSRHSGRPRKRAREIPTQLTTAGICANRCCG